MTTPKLIAASVLFAFLFVALVIDQDGFLFIVDDANLVFHEAGHPILGLFGETLGLYGGTLTQLVIPLLAASAFWRRREPVSSAVAGVWFFQNFLNIARYMADARAQALPLAGGGEHDWFNIFVRWGVLSWDTRIAGFVRTLGWLGMIAVWMWLLARWRASQASGGGARLR